MPTQSELTLPPVKRGDTLRALFVFEDAAGDPLDLGNCVVRIQIREARFGSVGPVLVNVSTADGTLPIDLNTATATLTVDSDVTATFPPGIHSADVERTYTGGVTISSETFFVNVIEDVTRV